MKNTADIGKKYKALLLDLFGTVVLFDERKLPRIRINGSESPSTDEYLYQLLPYPKQFPFKFFHEKNSEVRREIKKTKDSDMKEVSSLERFRRLTHRLSLPIDNGMEKIVEQFNREHMGWIKKCVEFPQDHTSLMTSLSKSYPLALVSNFDHAPTGYQILEEYGLVPFFQTILFSDEIGWCKPHPILFTTALERLGVTPEEALFVGDAPDLDVLGAKNIGMDVAWIKHNGVELPDDYPEPTYTLNKLTELPHILL